MRIFRGLENIHSVIDRHEAEWRREQGEEPERPESVSLEEAVRRRIAARQDSGSGRFSADRFLGVKHDSTKHEPEPKAVIPESEPTPEFDATTENVPEASTTPEPEIEAVIPESESTPEFDAITENVPEIAETPEPEPEIAPELDAIPDVIEVIPPKEGRHSWLYNEVLKAVNDAAKDRKNTKIISVFVPVVQDGGEFEDLPADGVMTLAPVNENATKPEPVAEAVEIIRNKDGKHSRLYDEVMRAITDAAGNGKFSKVVAVFVPVVQSKAEFEDMPFDEGITISAVNEDFANVESFAPEAPVNESDESANDVETLPEITESAEILDMAESESPADVPDALNFESLPEITESPEPEVLAVDPDTLPEIAENEPEISNIAELDADDSESPVAELEIPEEMPALEDPEEFDLLPETVPDAELAEAFREMEEKLDEDIQQEEEQPVIEEEPETEPEIEPEIAQEPNVQEPETITLTEETHDEPDIIAPENDDDEFSESGIPMDTGEAMRFEDISGEEQPAELLMPSELDDDEVFDDMEFDESLTEVRKPDDDGEAEIVIEEADTLPDDDDEIEILPDPVKL